MVDFPCHSLEWSCLANYLPSYSNAATYFHHRSWSFFNVFFNNFFASFLLRVSWPGKSSAVMTVLPNARSERNPRSHFIFFSSSTRMSRLRSPLTSYTIECSLKSKHTNTTSKKRSEFVITPGYLQRLVIPSHFKPQDQPELTFLNNSRSGWRPKIIKDIRGYCPSFNVLKYSLINVHGSCSTWCLYGRNWSSNHFGLFPVSSRNGWPASGSPKLFSPALSGILMSPPSQWKRWSV